jgi:DNA-binding response OmpR family regulator
VIDVGDLRIDPARRVVDDRSIDSLVSRVRKKLESDPAHPKWVQTVWGAGYRFTESAA